MLAKSIRSPQLPPRGFNPLSPLIPRLGRIPAVWSILLLVTANVVTFYPHYRDLAVFPWDFVGGYHAGAYSFLRDLYFGSLQQWEPHGTLGYPTALSLQNSSYYWPLMLLTLLGVPYTHYFAASFQSLHVLFAGFGMLALLLRRNIGWGVATIGAASYMYSAAFFSNAQHPDIVRGAAYIPWLFWLFSGPVLFRGRWTLIAGTLLLTGFLAGSYPGIILATAYALFLFFGLSLREVDSWHLRWVIVRNASLIVFASTLLVLPKYLPLAELSRDLALIPPGDHARLAPIHVLMLFFGFQSDGLPHDITVRSLYLPALTFLPLFFVTRPILAETRPFVAVALLSLAITISSPLSDALIHVLPGAASSRLFLSDYRPLLHSVVIVLSSTALHRVLADDSFPVNRYVVLSLSAALAVVVIATMTLSSRDVLAGVPGLVAAVLWGVILAQVDRRRRQASVLAAGVLVVLATSLDFWGSHRQVWVNEGFYKFALTRWEFDFPRFYEQARTSGQAYLPLTNSLEARPPRVKYDSYHDFGIGGLYTGSYVDLALDSGLRVKRTLTLLEAKAHNPALDRFVMGGSNWLVIPQGSLVDDEAVQQVLIAGQDKTSPVIRMTTFSRASSRYSIRSDEPFTLVENEVYFPGWVGKLLPLTTDGMEMIHLEAQEAGYGLRGWALPAGHYDLETQYALPLRGLSLSAAGLGAVMLLSFVAVRPSNGG